MLFYTGLPLVLAAACALVFRLLMASVDRKRQRALKNREAAYRSRAKKRQKLQANQLYPASMQVECPRAECLGLAYP